MYSVKNPMLPAASKDVDEILLMNFNLNSLVSAAPSYIYINFGSHFSEWATGQATESHYLKSLFTSLLGQRYFPPHRAENFWGSPSLFHRS